MAINSSENCRCYISNIKLCVEGSTHTSWSAGGHGSAAACFIAKTASWACTLIFACFNKLNLLGIWFIFLIKKLKPLLGLAIIERQLVMSSGVSSELLDTPAESPSAAPFTTYSTVADPGLCLCSALFWTHLCLPFPEARVWFTAALKARGAF